MPNPRTKEFPLRHKFSISFSLQEFEASPVHAQTIIPLFMADQAKTESIAQDLQTNPQNDAFEDVVNTPACFMSSRINMIKISEYVMIPTVADVPDMLYEKAVITFGLGDADITAPDGTTLRNRMGFTKAADTLHPTYSTTKCDNGGFMHADVDGLTSTQVLEGVAITAATYKSRQHGILGAKIRKMMIGPFQNRVHKDYPYWNARWYRVPGATKRMNAFTGCFLFVGVNPAIDDTPSAQQDHLSAHFQSDLTIEEESLNCHYLIEFNEFNDSFDQSA